MRGRARAVMVRALRRARAKSLEVLVGVLSVCVCGYVVAYPLTLVTYPPLTDLPFHAAQTSILRHYLEPSWHFREQFSLHPLEVPYITTYGVGALLALVMPFTWAMKCAVAGTVLALPAGLAVLFHGLKKSALWGALLGLGLAWNQLVWWGFLNYIGALGLYAASVGLALRLVDAPSPRRARWLGAMLVAVFFTHVYRLPFAVLAVLAAGAVMYPATRRMRPLFLPMVPSLTLFGAWLWVRPSTLSGKLELGLHLERLRDAGRMVFGAFLPQTPTGREELRITLFMGLALAAWWVVGALIAARAARRGADDDERAWRRGALALPLLLATGHLVAFLVLPMSIGTWWYVFPRELVAALYLLLAAAPDWPRGVWGRLGAVSLVAVATGRMALFTAEQFLRFEDLTRDFREVVALVPRAPRLFYLVFEHRGTDRARSPFTHLPAWVQAERGGWLDFHFGSWDLYPVQYRKDGVVPPPLPMSWEFTPQYFDVRKQGAWFDTFLVRHSIDPAPLFRADPTIHLVARRGTWWLYRRDPAASR